MSVSVEAVQLDIDGFDITGIRQRNTRRDDQPRMLCVHGWLDNANSFVPLMPYLPAFDMVAIDLPGHGYSDYLPGGYHMHELAFLFYRVMEQLQWSECHLMGHSLGACLLPILAVANPPCVQSLIMIDGVGPLSGPVSEQTKRLKKAMQNRLQPERFESRVFADKQAAIEARMQAATIHPASAKLIIDRQVQQTDKGYTWRFDKAWRYASWQYQTEEQVQDLLQAITCPTLAVVADEGYLAGRDSTDERLACIKHLETSILPGNHHLHMDTPEPIAAAINGFLQTTPALGG